MEKCPNCEYILVDRTTYCPICGTELTYPRWKKLGALALLILIGWGLIKCHIRMLDGFN